MYHTVAIIGYWTIISKWFKDQAKLVLKSLMGFLFIPLHCHTLLFGDLHVFRNLRVTVSCKQNIFSEKIRELDFTVQAQVNIVETNIG